MELNNELVIDDSIIGQFEDPGDVTEWNPDELPGLGGIEELIMKEDLI